MQKFKKKIPKTIIQVYWQGGLNYLFDKEQWNCFYNIDDISKNTNKKLSYYILNYITSTYRFYS